MSAPRTGKAGGSETPGGAQPPVAAPPGASGHPPQDRAAPLPAAPDNPALVALLLESLQALAAAGEVELACRLAGRAYVALRHDAPPQARRFDVFLHRVSRKLDW